MSRTFKKPYTKSKKFDKTCRNHGSCSWCLGNRMHKVRKKIYTVIWSEIKEDLLSIKNNKNNLDDNL